MHEPILTSGTAFAKTKPGIMSSELWLSFTCAAAIAQMATSENGMTQEQAIASVALALICGLYSLGRSKAKTTPK